MLQTETSSSKKTLRIWAIFSVWKMDLIHQKLSQMLVFLWRTKTETWEKHLPLVKGETDYAFDDS